MKKLIALLILMTTVMMVSPALAAKKPNLYKGKIVIGNAVWPGYLGLYVAQDKGYFQRAGLDVDVKSYIALGDVSKDYIAGKMQGRANLTLDAVKERSEGMDHKIILAIDHSNGSDTILARPGIDAAADLVGKRVAYEKGTLEEFFLAWMLSENGMKLTDVTTIDADPEKAANLLIQGEADAAVTYEPFSSKAVEAGNKLIYSSAKAPGLITDILTFRGDFIEKYPETVQAIINAYFEALDFCREHSEEADAILAKRLNATPKEVRQQLKGVRILDRRGNNTAFTFASGVESLYGNLRQVGKFVRTHTPDAPLLNTDLLIEPRFVKNKNE